MRLNKYFLIAIIVLALELITVIWLGSALPADARIPIHWNIHNQIDGWTGKTTAIFPFWLFNLGLFLFLVFSANLSPVYKQNRERYDAVIPPLALVLVVFFALMHVYMLLLGQYPQIEEKIQLIFVLMGGLFISLGNILPKLPRNYVAGIKTPWTFYSDENWRRTSRVGGYCFMLVGLMMLAMGLLNLRGGWVSVLMAAGVGVLIFVPIVYSFILYQKSKKHPEE